MNSGLTPYCVDWSLRASVRGGGGSDKVQQVEVPPEDALAAEEQSSTFQ